MTDYFPDYFHNLTSQLDFRISSVLGTTPFSPGDTLEPYETSSENRKLGEVKKLAETQRFLLEIKLRLKCTKIHL